jgi:penicillin-binding protein 1A
MPKRSDSKRSRSRNHSNDTSTDGLRLFFFLVAICACAYMFWQWKDIAKFPNISSLERYEPIEAIQIFDKDDHLAGTVEGDEDRRVVPLSQVSRSMQQAILAAEDHHFYEHRGVNPASIFRAVITNLMAGKIVEGGSTITQQLVKNLYFESSGRTFSRKIKEAWLAWQLEDHYSKDKILEMYLNQVYFGNGAYGIERAAQRYFGVNASNLDLAQSAFLAAMVKAPSELGTVANRSQAMARQREILEHMVEYGYITPRQEQQALAQKLEFAQRVGALTRYPFFISYVLQLLRERFSETELRRQGLRVYTTLDPAAQESAQAILSDSISHAPKGVSQAALVSVSVTDGTVVALVGGVGDFWKNQFNRATNPHTAGSSFKPFVYLTGLPQGAITPNSIVEDNPISLPQGFGLPMWTPKNFDHKYMGPIPVRKALALSRNVCSVRIAQKVGVDHIVETARLAGITSHLDPNLSLALGSSAVTPLDMASAFSTFARGGVAIKPRVLRRIEDNRGQVIDVFESESNKVFPSDPVADLVSMMQDVVRYGTGTMARLPDRPVAGKTGTADESKDIWFIGFTPDLCTAIWGGNDENKPIPGNYVTGGTVMAKIWQKYNVAYYDKHPTPPGSFLVRTGPENQNATPDTDEGTNAENPTNTGEPGQSAENPTAASTSSAFAPTSQQNEASKFKPFPLPSGLEQLTGNKTSGQSPSPVDQAIPPAPPIRTLRPVNVPPPLAPSLRPAPVMTTPQVSQFHPASQQQQPKFLPLPATAPSNYGGAPVPQPTQP